MIRIIEINDLEALYNYQIGFTFPYMFSTSFDEWRESMLNDIDGDGRRLFKDIKIMAAYDKEKIVGFIQYGNTAFGFDETGNISNNITYPVIRMIYFNEEYEEAGNMLVEKALEDLNNKDRIYAFFHYFGMSCYGRHGKLYEKYSYIERVLNSHGFVIEHENVYYSSKVGDIKDSDIDIFWKKTTEGNQQSCDFIYKGNCIGECEIHYIKNKGIAYLRWIYINSNIQNMGLGSKCMDRLKTSLKNKGISRLDTDTAINNVRAQHYYEKNDFIREGVTRSFYKNFK